MLERYAFRNTPGWGAANRDHQPAAALESLAHDGRETVDGNDHRPVGARIAHLGHLDGVQVAVVDQDDVTVGRGGQRRW